nr:tetratricopeptide repeat protein [Massilia sp. TS11]
MATQQRNILNNAGHLYMEDRKYAEAERAFRELMTRHAESWQGYYGMGKLLQEQGKAKDALPLLDKALGINPVAGAHYRIGKCWQQLGDKPKAIAAYEKALAFRPELPKQAKGDAEEQLKALKKT